MRKNLLVKIVAIVWLLWIIISVIWTWILAILSWGTTDNTQTEQLTEEQLQELLKNYNTWSTTQTWEINLENTWTTN